MEPIRAVTAEEVVAVRWPVLRPGLARESAVFEGDDAADTQHFGAFDGGEIVGVASLFRAEFPAPPPQSAWQLRGMATLDRVRGRGFGAALLLAVEDHARRQNAAFIWCNARIVAAEFYRRHGWRICSEVFDIPGVGPHCRMLREL